MSQTRVALYHRVSTRDQRPELARRELRAAAKQRGARVVLDVEETASGRKVDRPGWRRVLEAARAGKVDAVLVWKLDRAGRSLVDLLHTIGELERCRVALVATSQGFEFRGDAVSKLIISVLGAVAELERDLIAERTRLGLEGAKARGVQLGRPSSLTLAQFTRLVELRQAGLSLRRCGEELGVGRMAVLRALERLRDSHEKGMAATPPPKRSEKRIRTSSRAGT